MLIIYCNISRPILVLKCEQGFVGPKGVRLECNKANYETIQVVRGPKGAVYFKGNTHILLTYLPVNATYPLIRL